jgi:outer membrane putative beta-barrel porin/alpha-amylase
MTKTITAVIGLAVLIGAGPATAIDHKNLDENRPLRLEDAYSISSGEIAVEVGGGFRLARRGADQGFFPVEVLYGAFPNFQLGVGSILFTDPHEVDEHPKSGDLHLSALYNFNQETISVPAFGLKLGLDLPTGVDARGFLVEVKGIITKSIERLSLHLNAGYEFLTDTRHDERDGRYEFALGFSYPVGAPQFTRATLVGDVFAEQAAKRRESTIVGAELGMRYQLTPRIVWDVGVGTEFAGPADRSRVFFQTGFSFGF